jgi:biotin carboxylase
MNDVKGKRLLISGGPALACDIVEKAREMGVYTMVTDWYPNSPAKKIADESFMVSTADIDAMVDLARKTKAHGVFTQYTDSNLPNVQKICEQLGFPFCASAEQLELIGNKKKAKHLCMKHGISVPKEFHLTSEFLPDDLEKIEYPVLTKPVDNSGQRGISICTTDEELIVGYKKALEYSGSETVVVEKYLSGDYVVLCFTVQDGYLSLSAMADKPVIDDQYSAGMVKLPKGYILPSKYIDLFYSDLYDKFSDLAADVGLRNGSLGVEAIVNDGVFYIFEMQYRLGGMKHHDFVLRENSIDIMKMHINFALTGEFSGWNLKELDNPRFKKSYCLLNLLVKPGIIATIKGIESIKSMPEVINFLPMHKLGDQIELTGTVMQIFAKVSLMTDSKEKLLSVINQIHENLQILDEDENQMLLPSITENELFDL